MWAIVRIVCSFWIAPRPFARLVGVRDPLTQHRLIHPPLSGLLLAIVLLGLPVSVHAIPGDPSGGCPAPPNTLVLSELMVGGANEPRWVEITNPGKYALSLAKVTLQVFGEKGALVGSFPLGTTLPFIQAGEAWPVGDVPDMSPLSALLKVKILELGEAFGLPMCHGKVALVGPSGLIDAFEYDLCQTMPKPKATVLALDPAFTDPCKNDDQKLWCIVTPQTSPYGSPGSKNLGCDLDGDGYLSTSGDCDDLDPAVHLDAQEVCNGKDDDCNGLTDDDLAPPVGFCPALGICAATTGPGGIVKVGAVAHCEGTGGFLCDYPAGYEPAKETLCDGFDNDCDGLTDEGLLNDCGTCGTPPQELCNGKDDNCNGQTDEGVVITGIACGGTGVCLKAQGLCVDGTPTCVQDLAWQATETLCDAIDNDCDGTIDEMLADPSCKNGIGACAVEGSKKCGMDGSVICLTPAAGQPTQELCGNGLDDNCDGKTDEGFDVGSQCEAGQGICRLIGKKLCSADKFATTCSVEPGPAEAVESCDNGLDDNCDGRTDESGCVKGKDGGMFKGCGSARAVSDWGGYGLVVACAWLVLRRRVRSEIPRRFL